MAAALLIGSTVGALYLLGADFSRFTRPLGAAAGEARARTSDRAIQLWETVRFGQAAAPSTSRSARSVDQCRVEAHPGEARSGGGCG